MKEKNILVVDDNPDIMRLVKTVLTYAGYEVITASSGAAALDLLASHRFAAAVLDLSMPGVSGATVCQEIKRRLRIPVIVMTGHDLEEDLVRSVYGLADMIVLKPFDPMQMPDYVQQCLRRRPGPAAARTRQTVIQSIYM